MKEIIKLGLILFLIGSVAAAGLAFTYETTIDQIIYQRELADIVARQDVFPEADSFEKISEEKLSKFENKAIIDVYYAKSGDDVVGYVVKTRPSGFSGNIDVTTGVTLEGIITGVRIGNNQETPGLGAKSMLPEFYGNYNGLSIVSTIGVNKVSPGENEILAISGATITSQAVTDGVNFINEIFNQLNE